jgi:transcriptional regulator GlxA family with amidase domain
MAAAPEEDWPIARMARVSGVSVAHFSRAFGLAFGVPPHRYLLTLRLERATAILRDSDLPVTEVAFACGWTSLGTFSRTFRAVLGQSPSRYRAGPHASTGATAPVPACVLRAAHRPDLKIAVSEKQRREEVG